MEYPKIKDFRYFLFHSDIIKAEYGGILSEKFNLEYALGWREYIYTRTHLSMKIRHGIWEYLNDDITKIQLVDLYMQNRKH